MKRDASLDDDVVAEAAGDGPEREGIDMDANALAYIRARKNVLTLNKARKDESKK
jgi:hypothetical protein